MKIIKKSKNYIFNFKKKKLLIYIKKKLINKSRNDKFSIV
jgi:hypothetical protein